MTEKHVVFNNLERAVSTDMNRLQEFGYYSLSELAKWLFDAITAEEQASSNVITTGNGTEAPSRAAVINGLLPFIPAGTGVTSILVSSGLLFTNDFDSPINTDISIYKYVEDLGVSNTVGNTFASDGVTAVLPPLALTPNASLTLTRVDVIECARLQDVTLESDSRDIFNNITGLFTTATVPKVAADELKFRIRLGTPGAGYPGSVAGWLPLAVMAVPPSTNTLDTCDLWDVRPLVSDFAKRPFDVTEQNPETQQQNLFRASCPAAGPYTQLLGNWTGVLGDRILGGPMALNPNALDYIEQGAPPTTLGLPYYVYQATFVGLPRWARYFKSPSSPQPLRIPVAPRGVTIITQKGCDVTGAPVLALVAPGITGLTGLQAFTNQAKLAFAGFVANSSGDFVGMNVVDKAAYFDDQNTGTRNVPLTLISSAGTVAHWEGFDNVHWPGNATKVRVRFEVQLNDTTSDEQVNRGTAYPLVAADWNYGFVTVPGSWASLNIVAGSPLWYPFNVPTGALITACRVQIKGAAGHGGSFPPAVMPTIALYSLSFTGVSTLLGNATDASASSAIFEAVHSIAITGLSHTVLPGEQLVLGIDGESGTHAIAGDEIINCDVVGQGLNGQRSSWGVSSADATNTLTCFQEDGYYDLLAGATNIHIFELDIPLYPNLTGAPTSRNFTLTYGGITGTFGGTLSATVVGWTVR